MQSVLLFLAILTIACQKGNDLPAPQRPSPPEITAINPINNVTIGSTVIISGENFGTDLLSVIVKLDSADVAPLKLSEELLTFVIPPDLVPNGSRRIKVKVIVNGIESNTVEITVRFEPQGWRY